MFAPIHVISNSSSSGDTTPPTVPSGMIVSSVTLTSYTVTWGISTDAQSPPVEYRLYKNGFAHSPWQSSNSWDESEMLSNSRDDWKVKARDSASPPNESAFSIEQTFGTLCTAPTVTAGILGNTSNSIAIDISTVTNAVDYKVQYKESSSGTWLDYADLLDGQNVVLGLTPDTSYDIRAASNNINGFPGPYSSTYTSSTPPSSALNSFTMNPSGEATAVAACSLGTSSNTYYHDGTGFLPANGDIVYTDSAGLNVFNGLNNFFLIETAISGQISSGGVVSNLDICEL